MQHLKVIYYKLILIESCELVNMSKKWLLVIFVPLAIILLIAGAWYGLKLNKEKEVKDSFAKTLDMYPIKNLEDLYDKEGYRDENFDKNDKGTWVLYSEMAIKKMVAIWLLKAWY